MSKILIDTLAPAERTKFSGMTFPLFRASLLSDDPSVFAVGAMVGEQPAGLACAARRSNGLSEVLSVFVHPKMRGQGIGILLLEALEAEALRRGTVRFEAYYTTDLAQPDLLGRFLTRHSWSTPSARMLVCRASRKLLEAPWIQRYRLPGDYEVAPWTEVTAAEREQLEQRRGEIPQTLFPIDWELERFPLEPLNSIVLRRSGQVTGWLITHRTAPDTVRYTCAYVNDNLQRGAAGVGLIIEGIERQYRAMGSASYGLWATPFKYPAMIAFIRRRMAPHLDSLRESRESFKILQPAS